MVGFPAELSKVKSPVPPTTQAKLHQKSRLTYLDAYAGDARLPSICIRQQDVLWLEIPVNDPLAMENTHGSSNLLQEYADGVFAERSFCWEKEKGLFQLYTDVSVRTH